LKQNSWQIYYTVTVQQTIHILFSLTLENTQLFHLKEKIGKQNKLSLENRKSLYPGSKPKHIQVPYLKSLESNIRGLDTNQFSHSAEENPTQLATLHPNVPSVECHSLGQARHRSRYGLKSN